MLLTTDMSIAGQHIDSSAANKIYLTDRRVTLVDLPWTYEEGTNNIIPDYNLLEQKDKVDKYIKRVLLSCLRIYKKTSKHEKGVFC